MKRASLLLLMTLCAADSTFSQNFNWSVQAGSSLQDAGTAIAVDAEGFCYVTGYFQGTVTFQTTTLKSMGGSRDIFVAKYTRNGVLVWVRHAFGPLDEEGDGIAVDNAGNVYVTGTFEGTVNFGGSSVMSSGSSDMFVVKYNSQGVPGMLLKVGGPGQDGGNAVAVQPATGDFCVTGSFVHTAIVSFTGNSFPIMSAGSADIFVVCYDWLGVLNWAQTGGGANPDVGTSISMDSQRNTYVTGHLRSAFTWGTTPLKPSADDAFVVKYSPVGVLLWVRTMRGPGFGAGLGISVDAAGGPYVVGTYTDSILFSNSAMSLSSGTGNGEEIFVARYDTNGNLLWARRAGGPLNDRASGVCVRLKGDVYVTGLFGGAAAFSNQSLTSLGSADIFVARYTPNGVLQWVQRAGGGQFDYGRGVGLDIKGFAYVTGGYHSHPAGFPGAGGTLTNTSTGAPNFFLARIQ